MEKFHVQEKSELHVDVTIAVWKVGLQSVATMTTSS